MPLAINEFIYIPPHEWEKHKRLAALLREAYPEMALPVSAPTKCAQCQCQCQSDIKSSTSTKSTKVTKATEMTEMTEKNAPAVTAPLKRRAAQGHNHTGTTKSTTTNTSTTNTNTNTTHHSIGKSRWTSLGHGFWYSAGPTVAAPWQQWTWLDVAKQMARWMLVCCIVYAVLCAVRAKWV